MNFLFLTLLSLYNFQYLNSLQTGLYSNKFNETLSSLPTYTNSFNVESNGKYLLLDAGKILTVNNLEFGINIIVKRGDSLLYPNKLWNGLFAADYNTLYLKYTHNNFKFLIGRVPVKWSNSPISSLMFTGFEPGMDLIYYSLDFTRIKGDYFFSILRDRERYRYLAAHRIIVNPFHNFQFSFADIIMYQTPDGQPDFYYFNPFAIYYVRQWNLDSSGLTNSAFDFKGEYIHKNVHLYGELFVDDFPYIKVYHENPRIGGLLGAIYRKNNSRFLVEYKRVNRFTYCYYAFAPYLGFRYYSEPLGTPEGNDFDKLSFVLWHKWENNSIGVELTYKRQGEGNIFEEYHSTSEESEHYFLNGIVEKTLLTKLILSLKISRGKLYIMPSLKQIQNYRHQKSHNVYLGNISLVYAIDI